MARAARSRRLVERQKVQHHQLLLLRFLHQKVLHPLLCLLLLPHRLLPLLLSHHLQLHHMIVLPLPLRFLPHPLP